MHDEIWCNKKFRDAASFRGKSHHCILENAKLVMFEIENTHTLTLNCYQIAHFKNILTINDIYDRFLNVVHFFPNK